MEYINGDALEPIGDGIKIIVHCCNDIGKWGSGFVVSISRKWKKPEIEYRAWHSRGKKAGFELGGVQFVQVEDYIWIANMIGQHDIKRINGVAPFRESAFRKGFMKIKEFASSLESPVSIHMPKIGSVRAGGDWKLISRIIEEELESKGLPVTIYIFDKV